MVVHRLLAAALGLSSLPPQLRDASTLASLTDSKYLIPGLIRIFEFQFCGNSSWSSVSTYGLISMHDIDLNYRHRNAQMAGRASVELHTLIFFKKR